MTLLAFLAIFCGQEACVLTYLAPYDSKALVYELKVEKGWLPRVEAIIECRRASVDGPLICDHQRMNRIEAEDQDEFGAKAPPPIPLPPAEQLDDGRG